MFFHLVKVGPFPIAIIALILGTGLGWATSLNKAGEVRNASLLVKGYAPVFTVRPLFVHINRISPYLSTTIPTAISIAIGTIQCVESAKRAGDFYPTRESMLADAIGTIVASFFGSFLGMTGKACYKCSKFNQKSCIIFFYHCLAYIGHPAYKKMGARQGYSLINCLIYLLLCFFGVIALFLKVIAVVAVNPVIVSSIIYSSLSYRKKAS